MTEADYAQAEADYAAAVAANQALVLSYSGFGAINGARITTRLINGSSITSIAPVDVAAVTFTLFCDDAPVFSCRLIDDQSAFKLPAGFRSENIAVGLTGSVRVKSVKLAETMAGLKDL